jgi:hypothetical protein
MHVFTFTETKIPDRLDTFDFDQLTLKIITLARNHQTFQFFAKKLCAFEFCSNTFVCYSICKTTILKDQSNVLEYMLTWHVTHQTFTIA